MGGIHIYLSFPTTDFFCWKEAALPLSTIHLAHMACIWRLKTNCQGLSQCCEALFTESPKVNVQLDMFILCSPSIFVDHLDLSSLTKQILTWQQITCVYVMCVWVWPFPLSRMDALAHLFQVIINFLNFELQVISVHFSAHFTQIKYNYMVWIWNEEGESSWWPLSPSTFNSYDEFSAKTTAIKVKNIKEELE